MKNVTFICAEKKDTGTLAALAREIWREYWPFLLSEEQISYMVEKFQSEKALARQMTEENYRYYFIDADGEHAGYFGIAGKRDHLFLSKLYIKDGFRHQGLGACAFEKIKQLAAGAGYDKIRLTVNKNNKNAIEAYFKYGFKIIARDVTDIGGGFVMDDYIMEYGFFLKKDR